MKQIRISRVLLLLCMSAFMFSCSKEEVIEDHSEQDKIEQLADRLSKDQRFIKANTSKLILEFLIEDVKKGLSDPKKENYDDSYREAISNNDLKTISELLNISDSAFNNLAQDYLKSSAAIIADFPEIAKLNDDELKNIEKKAVSREEAADRMNEQFALDIRLYRPERGIQKVSNCTVTLMICVAVSISGGGIIATSCTGIAPPLQPLCFASGAAAAGASTVECIDDFIDCV
ncbi:hypothetical protein [Aquimarina latercula]|uniref:hypothetical protein n=1 Tax=Aquimarina latercula TaxID=987 RepID=UPI000414BEC5|nr:hypothetical protein [Aquimarina latercula]